MKYPLLSALFHPLFQRFADRPVDVYKRQLVNCLHDVTKNKLRKFSTSEIRLKNMWKFGKHQKASLIAPHFADRLLQENWIIQDTGRSQAAVHRAGGSWFLTDADLPDLRKIAGYAETEKEFQTLWRAFCKSIAIEERRNPRCQQTLLPLRFRPDMTEFQPDSGQPGAFWQDSRFDSLRKS